ncbi:hypothetical protein [Halomonas sp. A11-A]|uniref:hypothetical protein n=1 Tax=Halomonas sp. A11-A TaxID=2183985 RepID=UPI000D9D0DEF|nr:hypothetical protein [Halomonas sp. A11-A]PWV72996.1 hypothetical protein DER72_1168 [Halomonas sp. A11-A]
MYNKTTASCHMKEALGGHLHPPPQHKNKLGADVHNLLAKLDKVKINGPGRWLACCPAHDDRSPSLAIRETEDGTILLKCFTGCSTDEVLAAVGIDMHELFPRRDNDAFRAAKRQGERWVPRDVLAAMAREALVVMLAAEAVAAGKVLAREDLARLAQAAGRLRGAAKEVGCDV